MELPVRGVRALLGEIFHSTNSCKLHYCDLNGQNDIRMDERFIVESLIISYIFSIEQVLLSRESEILLAMLIHVPKSINHFNCSGGTLLHTAGAVSTCPRVIDSLLCSEIDPNILDKSHRTALHYAVYSGNIDVIVQLLAVSDISIPEGPTGNTVLHLACLQAATQRSYDGTSVLAELVRAGAAINVANDCGHTALHIACEEGLATIAHLLLESGADVNLGESGNMTDQLRESALQLACANGHAEVVRMLLEHGARPSALIGNGETAAHVAAGRGDLCIVEMLMASDPLVVTAKNAFGATLLHVATRRDQREVMRALLDGAADVDDRTLHGETALHWACASGTSGVETIRILISRGAHVNARARDGSTPLHCASLVNNTRNASVLLEHGADVNARDASGDTALHYACAHSHFHFAKLLVESGADVNARDADGATASHLAADCDGYLAERADLVIFLLEHGADGTLRNNQNLTALDIIHSN